MRRPISTTVGLAAALGSFGAEARAADPPVRFERVVIDDNLADAYQVEVADVDGDRKPDIVALGNREIAWYRNPTWTRRVIGSTKVGPLVADIISSATVDLDGDGRAEVAIACDFAMNTPTRGQLFLASQGATIGAPWTFRKIDDIPSIHRVRWADVDGDGRSELFVAPLFGPKSRPPTYDQDPARVVMLRPDRAHPRTGHWDDTLVLRRPVVHAVGISPPGADGGPAWLFTADNTGLSVAAFGPIRGTTAIGWEETGAPMVPGASGPAPKRGCSDFRLGRLGPDLAIVTIDPWHGSELVTWRLGDPPAPGSKLVPAPTRTVIDATLDDGHALWTADVDGDGTDEVFAGHRGKDHRVAMYRHEDGHWVRSVLDTAIAAQDLRSGDLDGDGVPDIVAVGGRTHNVVWYRTIRPHPDGKPR